ncbi:MAG: helix-turn-helix domain-containing protein [Synergistaceae bacterium]|jgi:excisionase family DNA binding protein|nr:helix-turn-helix domain-containing protein [Synergistaceae bacterium]
MEKPIDKARAAFNAKLGAMTDEERKAYFAERTAKRRATIEERKRLETGFGGQAPRHHEASQTQAEDSTTPRRSSEPTMAAGLVRRKEPLRALTPLRAASAASSVEPMHPIRRRGRRPAEASSAAPAPVEVQPDTSVSTATAVYDVSQDGSSENEFPKENSLPEGNEFPEENSLPQTEPVRTRGRRVSFGLAKSDAPHADEPAPVRPVRPVRGRGRLEDSSGTTVSSRTTVSSGTTVPSRTTVSPTAPRSVRRRAAVRAAAVAADPKEVERIREMMGDLFTVEGIAGALGITVRAVQIYLKRGQLRGVKIGGEWRVSADNLRRFVEGER